MGATATSGVAVSVNIVVVTEPPLSLDHLTTSVEQETNDEDEDEEKGLTALNQIHEKLQRKNHYVKTSEKQARLQVIRQKAAEAREQLKRMDQYLDVTDGNLNDCQDPEHPILAGLHIILPPIREPLNDETTLHHPRHHFNPTLAFTAFTQTSFTATIQRNQPLPLPDDPKSPLKQILQTKSWSGCRSSWQQ